MRDTSTTPRTLARRRIALACAASIALHASLFLLPGPSRSAGFAAKQVTVSFASAGERELLEAERAERTESPDASPQAPAASREAPQAEREEEPVQEPESPPAAVPVATGEQRSAGAASPTKVVAGEAALGTVPASPANAAPASGGGGRATTASNGDVDPAALLAARLAAAVEARKAYPEAARRRGTEGVARIGLRVGARGELMASRIASSSGSALLDRAALDLVASVFPVENPAGSEVSLELSIRYTLKK